MSMQQDISRYITDELATDIPGFTLEPDDDLVAQGVLDSLGILTLVAFLEEEFSIVVADDDVVPEHFFSVRSIEEFVNAKREELAA